MLSLLVVAESHDAFPGIQRCLGDVCEIYHCETYSESIDIFRKKNFDYVFIDIALLTAESSANDLKSRLQPFWHINPDVEIIVMAEPAVIRDAIMAVKSGASNYLTYPINAEEVKLAMEKIVDSAIMQSELDYLRDHVWDGESLDVVQTKSPLMKIVFEKVRSVAPTKSTVLLVGETGTGKGVIAKLVHRNSPRKNEQFISVHCGAIPDTLLESELFGHEKGAFTGAIRRKLGKFDIARGGTIFLDEISTITSSTQIKLLQVLQDGIFQRVGGEETIEADVRIIAATNVDLTELINKGLFRKDLYYRLNVFPIELPPLRDRKEDIELFVDVFLRGLNRSHGKSIRDIHPEVLEAFRQYEWPGNIRELHNLVERAYILEQSPILTRSSFSNELFDSEIFHGGPDINIDLSLSAVRRRSIYETEKKYLDEQLYRFHGRINETAVASGITSRQLHKLMRRYNLDKRNYKRITDEIERNTR